MDRWMKGWMMGGSFSWSPRSGEWHKRKKGSQQGFYLLPRLWTGWLRVMGIIIVIVINLMDVIRRNKRQNRAREDSMNQYAGKSRGTLFCCCAVKIRLTLSSQQPAASSENVSTVHFAPKNQGVESKIQNSTKKDIQHQGFPSGHPPEY
ncbi:hypothetical protein QBC44DRAFT_309516 [Cladorrhinum sp. PSN332]|nr:hypothetical protein QBC44DRAFT_309516 [Cladorrhinum sp. PSN332]